MTELNQVELDVLRMLLSGDHPVMQKLRIQLQNCRVSHREITGAGFISELQVADNACSTNTTHGSSSFGDVLAEVRGLRHGMGFVLYLIDGRMSALEGYTFEEPMPDKIEILSLHYTHLPRDIPELI